METIEITKRTKIFETNNNIEIISGNIIDNLPS